MRVLDAGCGTGNTVTGLAKQIPDVQFVGIDISGPSLEIATDAARADGVENVEFGKWNLLDRLPENDSFDVVMCLGVLHHTADMPMVLDNLSRALARDGEMFLWVYGLHGRYRHLLNARLLAMLMGVGDEHDDPVSTAREFIDSAGSGMVRDDLKGATGRMAEKEDVFREPAWIADQLFHPHEKSVDMVELKALIKNAGLELSEWLAVDERPETHFASPTLCDRFRRLSRHERLIALDLLLKPDRYFVLLEHVGNAIRNTR
jgi:SAM-dependent methyltransferase